jgi:CHAD domain-containing protein
MERMTAYIIPASFSDQDLTEAISRNFEVKRSAHRSSTRTYFDSFDWLLYDSGLGLFHEHNQYSLHLLQTGEVLESLEWRPRTRPRFWWNFQESGLREVLKEYIDVRCLIPVVRARLYVQKLDLLNTDQKTVLRGNLERLSVNRGNEFVSVADTLRFHPLRGYESELNCLDGLLTGLEHISDGRHTLRLVLDAAGIVPSDYVPKLQVPFDGGLASQQATIKILVHLIYVMRAKEDGIKSDLDTEFLHNFRVAVRKIRSALAQIKGVFPKEFTTQFRSDMSDIGKMTNRLRDLDVYLLSRDEYISLVPDHLRAGVDALFSHLTSARKREKSRVKRYLNSAGYEKTLSHWERALVSASSESGYESANSLIPVRDLARKFVRKQYRKILKYGENTDSMPDAEIHELRIMCKKLRYLLEFFVTLFPGKEMKSVVKILKDLQDNLGRFNDLSVQQNQLKVYLDEIKEGVSPSLGIIASIGGLVTALYNNQEVCKLECLKSFARFQHSKTEQRFKRLLRKPSKSNLGDSV